MRDGFGSPHVTVTCEAEIPITNIGPSFAGITDTTVILWYIGKRGLKKAVVDFYRDSIISPILRFTPKAKFCLFDLTAWNAFTCAKGEISRSSRWVDLINRLKSDNLLSKSAASIFNRIFNSKDKAFIDYLREILSRKEIWEKSAGFQEVGLSINGAIDTSNKLIENLGDTDVAKCYSAFQYIEGIILVESLVKDKVITDPQNPIRIDFVIPNDEVDYYSPHHNFQKDLKFFLSEHDCSVVIRMLPFQFGQQQEHRPYNIQGSKLSQDDLSKETIMGGNFGEDIYDAC